MKKKVFVLLAIALLPFCYILPSTKVDGAETKEKTSTYSKYIEQFSSRCASMARMRKSKLLNIRREAAMKCLKATFLETYKDELVEKMMADNVEVKEYKMQIYLNKKFFEVLNLAVASTHRARAEERRL